MEAELNTLNQNPTQPIQPEHIDNNLTKDDCPLLKLEPVSDQVQNPDIDELEKKYATFVRRDVYGVMGRGDLPWVEKLMLGVALLTVVPVRLVFGISVLVLYYLICRICTAFSLPNREDEQEDYAHMGGWRRAVNVQSGRFLSRVMLFIFGFYWIHETYRDAINFNGKFNIQTESEGQSQDSTRLGVIVSNHVSYLDILYHMSSSFPSFVAKWLNFL